MSEKISKKKNWLKSCLIVAGIIIGLFIIIGVLASIFVDPVVAWSKIKSPTNQKEISISGDTKNGLGKAKLYDNDKEIEEVDISNKKFTFEKVKLQEGDNKLKVSVMTKDGKSKTSSENNIVLDTVAPTIGLNQSDQETDKDKITISGKTEKDIEIKLAKGNNELSKTKTKNESFEFKNIKLDIGENKFIISVTDRVGNSMNKELNIIYMLKDKTNQPPETSVEQPAQTAQTTQSATPTPVTEKTTMDKLWIALDDSIKTRDKFDISYEEGTKIATITKQPSDYWDETALVKQAYQEYVKYGLKAFQIENANKIIFKYYDKFIDSYGKESDDVAIRIEMTKDEFQKFNWQNLVGQNIYYQMQDYSWIHLGIQKKLKIDKVTLLSL